MKWIIAFVFALGLALAPSYSEADTYIRILKRDKVWAQGKVAFRVKRGDILKVLSQDNCIHSSRKICWLVQKVKTNKQGYVEAGEMTRIHQIFNK
ncbi:MAG: hypothetical protein GY947_22950 [Rhodobacteraceae bacterium]|nr:hypothetical protein [Paracoccaceae bacterium]